MVANYDLEGEWDLFRTPEPIIEELAIGLDPMTPIAATISIDILRQRYHILARTQGWLQILNHLKVSSFRLMSSMTRIS
ncbi:hypothetical protein EV1_030281 [Malus domestica]